MSDRLALASRAPRARTVPDGLRDWNGYVLPDSIRTHTRDELAAIAWANGQMLSPELLHKWAYWRLLPAPVAGGPTGKGRGKGQRWSHTAAWRTAWISRWLTDTLTYHGIRLAIWPWTRALELERASMLIESVRRFLVQDRDYHARTYEALDPVVLDELDPYIGLMEGDQRPAVVAGALDIAGVAPTHPLRAQNEALFEHLGFDELEETAARLTEADLKAFIDAWRASTSGQEDLIKTIFWNSPIGLARILVRELHRARLVRQGVI